jgi:hypothetical protein
MFQRAVKAAAEQAGLDLESSGMSIPTASFPSNMGMGVSTNQEMADRVAKSVVLQMRSRRRGGGSNEWRELEQEANTAYDRIRNRFQAGDFKVCACVRIIRNPQPQPYPVDEGSAVVC